MKKNVTYCDKHVSSQKCFFVVHENDQFERKKMSSSRHMVKMNLGPMWHYL
jgi:hypothetical protein